MWCFGFGWGNGMRDRDVVEFARVLPDKKEDLQPWPWCIHCKPGMHTWGAGKRCLQPRPFSRAVGICLFRL